MKIKKFTYINLTILLTIVLVGCEENQPPIIIGLHADPAIIEKSGNSTLSCIATDADGDKLEYTWKLSSGSIAGDGSIVIWTAPDSKGVYIITCIVEDGNGGQDIGNIIVTVDPFDILGTWDVSEIEGFPISVDSSNSVWIFDTQGDYEWFLLLINLDLQGKGHYSFDGDSSIMILDGPATDVFGANSPLIKLTISNDNNTFSLLDSDGDRWTYNRRVE